ncbi:hypothetical protein DITRI_Ditri13aG0070300 [Diplodiscus trichospermus]
MEVQSLMAMPSSSPRGYHFIDVCLLGFGRFLTTTTWDSDVVDSRIRNLLSNRNNVRKVIGLDVERSIVEDSETEDCHLGSYWSYRKKNESRVTNVEPKRTVNEDPTETKDSKMKSRVAILQLCDGDTCLIIQLLFLDSIPKSLLNFPQLPDFTFLGIGIKETLAKLEKEYGLGCKNAMELGQLAASVMQMPHMVGCGLDFLALMVDSLKLDKPTSVVFSDWGKERLNKKQIKFAAANAFAYFKIGNKLLCG